MKNDPILDGIDPDILERARRVRMILLDVDGVLTDGRVQLHGSGDEGRTFDIKDGLGIRLGQAAGLTFGIITGRESAAVARRAAELDIDELHQQVADKGRRLDEILARRKIDAEHVCFMGDDLIDLPVMRRIGLAAAPADAVSEVREVAHHVTLRRGGRGAVRELVELVLRAGGAWPKVIERYYR